MMLDPEIKGAPCVQTKPLTCVHVSRSDAVAINSSIVSTHPKRCLMFFLQCGPQVETALWSYSIIDISWYIYHIQTYTNHTWWLIPLSKWVITPVINGISRVNPLITGVITHLLSGMNHQVVIGDISRSTRTSTVGARNNLATMVGAHTNVPDFPSIGIYNAPKGYDYESTMEPNNKVMCFHRGGNFIRINGWSIMIYTTVTFSYIRVHFPLENGISPVAMFFFNAPVPCIHPHNSNLWITTCSMYGRLANILTSPSKPAFNMLNSTTRWCSKVS